MRHIDAANRREKQKYFDFELVSVIPDHFKVKGGVKLYMITLTRFDCTYIIVRITSTTLRSALLGRSWRKGAAKTSLLQPGVQDEVPRGPDVRDVPVPVPASLRRQVAVRRQGPPPLYQRQEGQPGRGQPGSGQPGRGQPGRGQPGRRTAR